MNVLDMLSSTPIYLICGTIILFVAAIITAVVIYIRKEKKKGVQCVGCPDAKTCAGKCAGCSGCGAQK